MKQHEPGVKTADLCREHRISNSIFFHWKSKCRGMDASEAQPLHQKEDQKRRLKALG
jgi:putative transposase